MSIWKWLLGGDVSTDSHNTHLTAATHGAEVNPATGLPMVDGCSGVDVGGNPYGMDWQKNSFSDAFSNFNEGCDLGSGVGNDWLD
jgi:hypothetical protein